MLRWDSPVGESDKDVKEFLFGALDAPLNNLEMSLQNYEPSEEPFNISAVPKEVKSQPLTEKKVPGKKPPNFGVSSNGPTSPLDAYAKLLSSIPEFSSFGLLFKSSAPVELTEAETEYSVNVVKHIYNGHVVFQYNCTNTIPEQLLENVTVIVNASETEEFAEVALKPLKALLYDSQGQTFVAFEKPDCLPTTGRFSNLLKFVVKEVDRVTGEAEEGVEDEYQLEDLEVVVADYILRVPVLNFKLAWDSMGPACERVDEYGLGVRESLAEAVNAVTNLLGMQPCEGSVEELFGFDLGPYAIAAAEDCSKRLGDYVNIDILNAVQRTAAKTWISQKPFDKDACVPDLKLLLVDAVKLEKDFLESILWWNQVLNFKHERNNQENIVIAVALYNKYFKLPDGWKLTDSRTASSENKFLRYDGPKMSCFKQKNLDDRSGFGNIWKQYIPPNSDVILTK